MKYRLFFLNRGHNPLCLHYRQEEKKTLTQQNQRRTLFSGRVLDDLSINAGAGCGIS